MGVRAFSSAGAALFRRAVEDAGLLFARTVLSKTLTRAQMTDSRVLQADIGLTVNN